MPDPDASPKGEGLGYVASLDGIRALAVLGVITYHAGISWLPAGFLGVDTFFVLSGFLITTLLLNELRHTSTVTLGAFWARRARRLLPAIFLVVSFCAVFVWFGAAKGTYPGFRLDALSSLLYVANWHFVLQGASYFVATSAPSTLTHTWSLAIEEQFYVIWPLVLLGLAKTGRGAKTLLILCGVGAVASTVEMAWLHGAGSSVTRLYYGTDTHAQCLFVGAGLAAGLALLARSRRERGTVPTGRLIVGSGGDPAWAAASAGSRRLLSVVGFVGLAGGAALWAKATWTGPFLYQGGFLLMAVFGAMVIASAVMHQRGALATALSFGPLTFIGRISYGLYLWHYPLFQWLDSTRTGLSGVSLLAVRLGATFLVAVASFFLIERPIRHGAALRGRSGAVATALSILVTVSLVVAATSAVKAAGSPATLKRFSTSGANLVNPVRVMVVGDSTALTLAFPLSQRRFTHKYDAIISDQALEGCGVITSDENTDKGILLPSAPECATTPPPGTQTFFDKLAHDVVTFRPDVVALLVGRWEVHDQVRNGQTVSIEDPAFRADVRKGLERAISLSTAHGAHVVLYTQMCADSGRQSDGTPWPEDSPTRLATYNAIARSVAAKHRKTVSVFDLNRLVCPGGRFTTTIRHMAVRQADGVHIDITAGSFFGPRLWPALIAAGNQAREARHAAKH